MPSQSPLATKTPIYNLSSNSKSTILSTTPTTIEKNPLEANSKVNSSQNKKYTHRAILIDIQAIACKLKEGEELRDKHSY